MTLTFFGAVVYILGSLWSIIVALFNDIVLTIQMVITILTSLLTLITNTFSYLGYYVPSCLLPCAYVILSLTIIRFVTRILKFSIGVEI